MKKVIIIVTILAISIGLYFFLKEQTISNIEDDTQTATTIQQITTDQLATKLKGENEGSIFIDVREQYEYDEGHIKGMLNFPLSTLHETYKQIPIDKEVVIICRSGNRSMKAANILKEYGYKNITNVQGGISSWNGKLY